MRVGERVTVSSARSDNVYTGEVKSVWAAFILPPGDEVLEYTGCDFNSPTMHAIWQPADVERFVLMTKTDFIIVPLSDTVVVNHEV